MKKCIWTWLVLCFAFSLTVHAQNPQTQTNPNFYVNAGWANGISQGYAPTYAATGLTLNLGAGTTNCFGALANYSAGTLTMANNTTNYVYLDGANSCVPAHSTSTFTNIQAPLAVVTTSGGNITAVADERMAMGVGSAFPCSPTTPNGVPFIVTEILSGGTPQPLNCSLPGLASRNVSGASDTILTSDCLPKRIKYTDTSGVAVTLPTATTLGVAACTFVAINASTSAINVTITPTAWAIDRGQGAGPVSTLVIAQHQKCLISVDAAGGQWDADCNTTN